MIGVRSFEPGQYEYIEETSIGSYSVDDIDGVLEGLSGPVYVHVDLDVLDPSGFSSACYLEPDGMSVEALLALVSRVNHVVGASITEHAPVEHADAARDADVVRQIGAALAAHFAR